MRGKWLALGVAAVLAGVGGGALSLRYRRPAAPQPVPTSGAAVVANHEITLQGKIRPQHITSVSAPVNGLVETLLADVGQEVMRARCWRAWARRAWNRRAKWPPPTWIAPRSRWAKPRLRWLPPAWSNCARTPISSAPKWPWTALKKPIRASVHWSLKEPRRA